MKGLLTSLFTILLVAGTFAPAFAQQDSEFGYVDSSFMKKVEKFDSRKLILKTNPLAIISGDIPLLSSEFRLVAEMVTGPKTGLVIGASYLGMGILLRSSIDADTTNPPGFNSWDIGFNGFRLQGGFKFYLKNPRISITDPSFNPAPKGIYIFPLVSYSRAKLYEKVDPNTYDQFQHLSVTVNFGIQFLLGERVTLDQYVGVGYKKNQVTNQLGGPPTYIDVSGAESDFIYGSNIKVNFGLNFGIRF